MNKNLCVGQTWVERDLRNISRFHKERELKIVLTISIDDENYALCTSNTSYKPTLLLVKTITDRFYLKKEKNG